MEINHRMTNDKFEVHKPWFNYDCNDILQGDFKVALSLLGCQNYTYIIALWKDTAPPPSLSLSPCTHRYMYIAINLGRFTHKCTEASQIVDCKKLMFTWQFLKSCNDSVFMSVCVIGPFKKRNQMCWWKITEIAIKQWFYRVYNILSEFIPKFWH